MDAIVQRAATETVTDIGQLSTAELKALKHAVKSGTICKGKGGAYPVLKTVYAPIGYDFTAGREIAWQELERACELDRLSRTKAVAL